MKHLLALGGALLLTTTAAHAEIKALLCAGDYGMNAQDRVPLIRDAVEKAAPGLASWESEQAYNFTSKLENSAYLNRFDVVVMGDIAIGQLTPRAQENLVKFVNNGGGLVYDIWAKSSIPFHGAPEAVPMPLIPILPYAYPDSTKPTAGAELDASDAPFWKGIDWAPLKDAGAVKQLPNLLIDRPIGKGRTLALAGAFGPSWAYVSYANHKKVEDGWDAFPQLGEVWKRVLTRASAASPILVQTRTQVDAKMKAAPLKATVTVDATKEIDDIRAANFSIVALQQLYNEDGAAGEDLFLALNPRDWFDRRSQEVLGNTKGIKADKPAFFREDNIKGIYMAGNSYGSYGQWDDKKFAAETAAAVDQQKKYPDILRFFQAGNEPPLDENYVKFHKRFVGDVLKGAPDYKVVGPNKAFNILGVNPKEMQFYIDEVGSSTDVLNWHTYAQPPSTVLAEARYWSDKATGKLRTPGQAKVMFTESDAWNSRDSQFNYLMERAFTFLPEPRIIANFQYCMRPRSEGGSYRFGVLQPDGEMSANYNGFWIWRALRGRMTQTTIAAPAGAENIHAISSSADGGKTVTTVVYYDTGYMSDTARADSAEITVSTKLPAGNYKLTQSRAAWNLREETPGLDAKDTAKATVTLKPCEAVALTYTRQQ